MRNVLTITRRELNAYFVSPIAYILLAMFGVMFGYFFFSSVAFFVRSAPVRPCRAAARWGR